MFFYINSGHRKLKGLKKMDTTALSSRDLKEECSCSQQVLAWYML
jgi:hypothetical protein